MAATPSSKAEVGKSHFTRTERELAEKHPVLVVVGSSNTDLVLGCERLPRPGETLLGGDFHQFHGGKGANQAVAAARAGAQVSFIGVRGDDDFGTRAEAALRREKIETRRFRVAPKTTSGVALILVGGRDRENIIGVARSANDLLSRADIARARLDFRRAAGVIAQLEVPLAAVQAAARLAAEFDVPFFLNPAPARVLPSSLLRQVHTLTPNETEAFFLTREKDPARAGKKLLQLGCRQVVITLGAKGALLVDRTGAYPFSAPKVRPVDTVGAGDCFSGWLAAGLAEKLPLDQAIRRALAAASLSVTRPGAQNGMPYRLEVHVN